MRDVLKQKLHEYIRNNNPEILLALEAENSVSKFIDTKVDAAKFLLEDLVREDKPAFIIEEVCLNELTKEFKPSKFNYIVGILEEDFEFAHQQLSKLKVLQYEVVNMIEQCKFIFDAFNFNEENEDNRDLKYAVTGVISEYLDGNL
jgi:hypothetical protein